MRSSFSKLFFYFAVKILILCTTISWKSSQTLVLMQTSKFWLRMENSLHASSRNTFAVLSYHIWVSYLLSGTASRLLSSRLFSSWAPGLVGKSMRLLSFNYLSTPHQSLPPLKSLVWGKICNWIIYLKLNTSYFQIGFYLASWHWVKHDKSLNVCVLIKWTFKCWL